MKSSVQSWERMKEKHHLLRATFCCWLAQVHLVSGSGWHKQFLPGERWMTLSLSSCPFSGEDEGDLGDKGLVGVAVTQTVDDEELVVYDPVEEQLFSSNATGSAMPTV